MCRIACGFFHLYIFNYLILRSDGIRQRKKIMLSGYEYLF